MNRHECGATRTRHAVAQDIDVHEAHRAVQEGAFLLDVRSGAEYRSGHAPGSVLVPLPVLHARLSEVPRDRRICVICHSGGRSAVAAHHLVAAGYDDVANVRGGMAAWIAEGLPVEPEEPQGGILGGLLSGRLWPRFGR